MKNKIWFKISLFLIILLLLTGALVGYFFWRNNYRDLIYPGIRVGSLNLSKETPENAQKILSQKTEEIINNGLLFQLNNKNISVAIEGPSFDSALSLPVITFDIEKTIQEALNHGQPKNFFNYLLFRFKPKSQKIIKLSYVLDEEKIKNILRENFKDLEIQPENAYFFVSEKTGELDIFPEKTGKEINYELIFSEIKNNLDSLENKPIIIKTRSKYPSVKANDLKTLSNDAKNLVNGRILQLTINESSNTSASSTKIWTIKTPTLLSWVSAIDESGLIKLSLDQEKIKQYLSLNISPEIDLEAIRPRFEIKNGKVVNWQTGVNGKQIDLEASAKKISDEFLNEKNEISVVIKEIVGQSFDSESDLKIKEIIGSGQSDFSGSPSNRRKNIQVGANAVHGVLLSPGEEFSLVKALGEVDEKSGYFPELVIKGNKTVPEFGGGLCQIATTIFRAALNSGLPITERRNHSYRVSYYEPAGTDAAVYLPKPDVRFINDTNNYILIQSRIVKNIIYFDFWGTKDGRTASTTKPVIYNIVKPAQTKYIETEDLEPGITKCTEKAHNGADAYFNYTVVYPEGSTTTPIQTTSFKSHYVPWQEVCLIGKGSSASSTQENNSTTSSTTNTGLGSTSDNIKQP